jgi:hypothetical protein
MPAARTTVSRRSAPPKLGELFGVGLETVMSGSSARSFLGWASSAAPGSMATLMPMIIGVLE